jgi:hypothetical protein
MKKAVALVLVLAVSATMLFAAPVSGSVDIPSVEITLAGQSAQTDSTNDAGDLFAGIEVAALTADEAQAVEGAGWFPSLSLMLRTAVRIVVAAIATTLHT